MKNTEYIRALILLQSFEVFWTFCSLSDGELHADQCKNVSKELIKELQGIYKTDRKIFSSKELTLDDNDDTELIEGIIEKISKWSEGNSKLPYEGIFESNWRISWFTSGLKTYLIKVIGADVKIPIVWSTAETRYSKTKLRWGGHLPEHMLNKMPEKIEVELSQAVSIAVVGDIRKSQDLMTYSPSTEFFCEMMLDFMDTSRKLITENAGIFDKFTGDGFLAYFNEEVCRKAGKDFLDCFISFVKSQMEYSEKHFPEWAKSIRKVQPGLSGLTIGADIGKIDFREVDGHLFAIGDSIVWAHRVCRAGKGGEILVNNILYNRLKTKKGMEFQPIESETKEGELFLAHKMKLS
ncbi:MAG: hypothetical protein K9J16_03270 [Melioribacteraceae bacterium]|nr:hypothetical protein [Melioribacteraceae bacterium]MCF8355854.1 hypothetical protein [Melioribacteraceae bacterium]MCF8392571.1 hypothetical protein [Melioribacteraceae bacterium]MCF8418557.1 hypothetical protein [Melioribacteraceae bacterium]